MVLPSLCQFARALHGNTHTPQPRKEQSREEDSPQEDVKRDEGVSFGMSTATISRLAVERELTAVAEINLGFLAIKEPLED